MTNAGKPCYSAVAKEAETDQCIADNPFEGKSEWKIYWKSILLNFYLIIFQTPIQDELQQPLQGDDLAAAKQAREDCYAEKKKENREKNWGAVKGWNNLFFSTFINSEAINNFLKISFRAYVFSTWS